MVCLWSSSSRSDRWLRLRFRTVLGWSIAISLLVTLVGSGSLDSWIVTGGSYADLISFDRIQSLSLVGWVAIRCTLALDSFSIRGMISDSPVTSIILRIDFLITATWDECALLDVLGTWLISFLESSDVTDMGV